MPKSLPHNPKLFSKETLLPHLAVWEKAKKTVVFTNGCFDILHPGHVAYLAEAKALGDYLVLGLNSDDSVKRLNKGPERPLNNEVSRSFLLQGLACIDAIVVFNEDTPMDLIKCIKPNILVKGGDYDENENDVSNPNYIVGKKEVESWGGKAKTIEFVTGFSTSNLVNKIKQFG